jgi:hypothetical protein
LTSFAEHDDGTLVATPAGIELCALTQAKRSTPVVRAACKPLRAVADVLTEPVFWTGLLGLAGIVGPSVSRRPCE